MALVKECCNILDREAILAPTPYGIGPEPRQADGPARDRQRHRDAGGRPLAFPARDQQDPLKIFKTRSLLISE